MFNLLNNMIKIVTYCIGAVESVNQFVINIVK